MNQAKRPPNIPHQGPEHLTGEWRNTQFPSVSATLTVTIAKVEMNADCTL